MFLLLIPICFIASLFFFFISVIVLFGVCYCVYDEEIEIDLAPQNEKKTIKLITGIIIVTRAEKLIKLNTVKK